MSLKDEPAELGRCEARSCQAAGAALPACGLFSCETRILQNNRAPRCGSRAMCGPHTHAQFIAEFGNNFACVGISRAYKGASACNRPLAPGAGVERWLEQSILELAITEFFYVGVRLGAAVLWSFTQRTLVYWHLRLGLDRGLPMQLA